MGANVNAVLDGGKRRRSAGRIGAAERAKLTASTSSRKFSKLGLLNGFDSRLLSAEMTAFRGEADIGQIDGTVLHLYVLFTEKPNAFDVVGFFLPDNWLCFDSAVCEDPGVESEA